MLSHRFLPRVHPRPNLRPGVRAAASVVLLAALADPGAARQLAFRNFGTPEGLVDEVTRCVLQDSRGFLWIGTDDGLSRYDGTRFVSPDPGAPSGRPWVNACAEDTAGTVWFACGSRGLARFLDDRLVPWTQETGGPGGALCVVRGADGAIHAGWDGVYRFDGAALRRVETPGLPATAGVFALHAGGDRLWVGTDLGLHVFRRGAAGWEPESAESGFGVTAFLDDPDGSVWVGTDRGLRRYADGRRTALPRAWEPLAAAWVRSLLRDHAGTLWTGTNGAGVFHAMGAETLRRYTVDNGLAGNNVLGIAEDREGGLWFATTTGLSRLANEEVTSYTVRDGLVHNLVMCLAKDPAGDLWIGTAQGVSRLRGTRVLNDPGGYGQGNTFTLFSLRDRGDRIWMGSELGIARLDPGGERFRVFGPAQGWTPAPSNRNRARTILEDDAGRLWFGNDWGVSLWDGARFHTWSWPHEGDSLVCGLVADRGGDLWVGWHSSGGVRRFRVEPGDGGAPRLTEVAVYGPEQGLTDGRIRSALRDSRGNLWFGTRDGGAFRIEPGPGDRAAVTNLSTVHGLRSNYVRAILEDRRGNLWFGTDEGAACLLADPAGRTRIRHVTTANGLPGSIVQFILEDADTLWLGTNNGVAQLVPAATAVEPAPPPVYITDFRVLGVPDTLSRLRGAARLSHDRNTVAFEYVGVSFAGTREVRYRTRLAGLEEAWQMPTSGRLATYSHLPPGEYRFQVEAQNADGMWSRPAELALVVTGPWWRSAWFLVLAAGTAAGLGLAAHRIRVRQILQVERLRTRIAADLHDDIGSTLSSISIFSDMARREVSDGAPVGAILQRIGASSRATLEAMNDIVWSVRPENDAMSAVIPRMREFAGRVLEAAGASCRFEVGEEVPGVRLDMRDRRDLYLVFKEAVTNVARHAGARRVHVALAGDGGGLVLRVADDGRGFAGGAARGNGLGNMERRARSMGADFRVESAPGEGTTVTLTLGSRRRP